MSDVPGVRVYTTSGSEAGERFRYPEFAERWLQANGYQPRPNQPDEWVKLASPRCACPLGMVTLPVLHDRTPECPAALNQFASLVRGDAEQWKPNYGKQQ